MSRTLEWRGDGLQIAICCIVVVLISWMVTKIFRHKKHGIQIGDPHKGHRWFLTDFLDKPTYCNECEAPVVRGGFCESCGVCVHEECIPNALKTLACKVLVLSKNSVMKHHWVKGNLPLCSVCSVCSFHCGTEPRLCDFRCVWCKDKVHEGCVKSKTTTCDLGRYSRMILPPNCISLAIEGWARGRKQYVVKEVCQPNLKHWSPMLVFANRRSGDNEGERLISLFRSLLNPVQVIDLHEVPPESALEFCKLLGETRCRIVVCGGDGSVGWVLAALDKVDFQDIPEKTIVTVLDFRNAKQQTESLIEQPFPPYISIVPLGTGNDLARVLGWGSGYVGEEDVSDILAAVETAKVVPVDRWKIVFESRGYFGMRKPRKVLWMNNYFSVGCDAKVVLNFHQYRESQPSLFTSRIFNKAVYGIYGARDVLEQGCKDLNETVELELDGKKIDLPALEGIVVLNINSWCGGCNLWQGSGDSHEFRPSSFSDGLLEVVGLYSALHIARLHVNLADPLRLGQAKAVKITLKDPKSLPVQIDGEPWEQGPSVITVLHHNQTLMLQRTASSQQEQ